MRISAKADYAVRAAVELAAAGDRTVKGEALELNPGDIVWIRPAVAPVVDAAA